MDLLLHLARATDTDTNLSWDTGTRAGASFKMVDGEIKILENQIQIQVFKNGKTGFEQMAGLPVFQSQNPVHPYQDLTQKCQHSAVAWLYLGEVVLC